MLNKTAPKIRFLTLLAFGGKTWADRRPAGSFDKELKQMTVKGRDFVSLGKKIGGIVLTIIAAAFIFIGLLLGFGALVTT
ncbi:MAG: hypothetical protein LBU18_06895, partial [Treponema sp.]|nr:hypothetical protein [Treponema sp.]